MPAPDPEHEFNSLLNLRIERIVEISLAQIWSAWTDPKLIVKWFAPNPWQAAACDMDMRPGGNF